MPELDYFKKELIKILTEQEKEIKKSRGYPVGTIREWKGKKFKKVSEGKWVKVYESVSRGAKLSIAAVKRKIDHAQSAEELMKIVLMNKQRFIGNDGFLLPIVKELNEYIDRKKGPLEESKETEKQGSRSETVKAFQKLADVLEKGAVETVIHPEIGEILVESGTTGKHGYGLKHIIEQRYLNDKLTIDEISMLVPLVVDAAQTGKINKENSKTIEVEKNGIICIIAKQKFGKDEKWVLTGFEDKAKKEEATDAIQTGIARYSYTPEYSYFRKQAGAVIASLSKNISQSGEKSSGKGIEERKEEYKAQYKKFCEKLKLSASDQNIEDSVTRMLSKIEKKDGELLEILKNSSNKMSRMMFFGETGINLEGKSSREAEEIVKKYLGKEKADEYEAKLRERMEGEKKQEEERKESEFHALSHSIDASEENKALFGEYLRELPPKARKKTAQYFSKRWRYEVSGRDKAGSIVQFLSDKIESDQFKELKENVSWREYGKNGELTEKKDPFRLTFLDGSFTVLKKTEGQFAKWLLEKKSAGKR